MKALVGTFNQEKALVGAFAMIVKPMEHYTPAEAALSWPREDSWACAAAMARLTSPSHSDRIWQRASSVAEDLQLPC